MILEAIFTLWLLGACVQISFISAGNIDPQRLLLSVCYIVLPYWAWLGLRAFYLMKAQALRRVLLRRLAFRVGEHTRLVGGYP